MLARQAVSSLRSGWGRAALVAAVILAVGFLLNVVLAWMQLGATDRILSYSQTNLANPIDTPGIIPTALLSLMFWHGVAIGATIPVAATADVPFLSSIEASANLTFMLGFALTGYLLYRAGKWLADRKPESGWLAGAAGIQIALFYGAFMLIAGVFTGWDIDIPATVGAGGQPSVRIEPSLLGAFAIPFLLAAFAATAGAVSGRLAPRERSTRLTLAGISGGWRAAWLAVALGSIGFLIVAALNPDVTRAYLELAPGGAFYRTALVVGTLLIVPNIGTGIAAAAMGGSINLAALGDSCAVISYMQFPQGIAEQPMSDAACALPFALGAAPFQYWLFLLVPLVATFAGGWLAAQHAGATEAGDGALAGATIAIPYALWLWLLALVARVGYSAEVTFGFELKVWIGPGLLSTVLLALVWGLAGGAIGGAFAARKASEPGIDPGPLAQDSVS